MTTPQVVINCLKRSLNYTEGKLDSSSTFYKKGVENLKQIRSLALKVAACADEILKQYDEGLEDNTICIEEHVPSLNEKKAAGIIKPEVHKVAEDVNPLANIPKTYKSITRSVASMPIDDFCSESSYRLAQVLSMYFYLRFDSRNDPDHIHHFRRDNFKDYMMAWVVTYAHYEASGDVEAFFDEAERFCKRIRSKKERYTLPKMCIGNFFLIRDQELELEAEIFDIVEDAWSDLWISGYREFYFVDTVPSDYLPERDLESFIKII